MATKQISNLIAKWFNLTQVYNSNIFIFIISFYHSSRLHSSSIIIYNQFNCINN